MPYMELFVPKLDQHTPFFAFSEKAYANQNNRYVWAMWLFMQSKRQANQNTIQYLITNTFSAFEICLNLHENNKRLHIKL